MASDFIICTRLGAFIALRVEDVSIVEFTFFLLLLMSCLRPRGGVEGSPVLVDWLDKWLLGSEVGGFDGLAQPGSN